MRLTAFAMVAMKRIWRVVNLVSNGVPPDWSNATVGRITKSVIRGRTQRFLRRDDSEAHENRILDSRATNLEP
jgi:hypothetical protein